MSFPFNFSDLGVPIIGSPSDVYASPIIDEVSALVTYVGYGNLGADPAKAVWRILRITKTAASPPCVTTVEYAGGSMKADQIWDDRATLSYAR